MEDRIQGQQSFDSARKQARWDQLRARIRGRDTRMLPFEIIRHALRRQNPMYTGVQEIPVDRIMGSVGRLHEFNRHFLPLEDSVADRWVNIELLAVSQGWPPIKVYKVGDAFFVRDGNHRTSVARELEMATIEAEVWEFPEEVQIAGDESLDEILIRLSERRFMEETHLDERYPDHGIHFTVPGRYSELSAQIRDMQRALSAIDGREVGYDEAVEAWYEMTYLPTIQIIRESTLLADFPGRTEADLFAWISLYRDYLEELLGDQETLRDLAQILAERYKEGNITRVARQVRRLLGSEELPPLAGLSATDEEE